MKKVILFTMSALFATSLFAGDGVGNGEGPDGTLIECSGKFEFVVRRTAAPNYIQGLLTVSNGQYVNLECKKGSAAESWKCVELREGDGKWLVDVQVNRATHMISADVKLEQMFPLGPKKISSLHCIVPVK
jgi:hypothetical protein